MILFFRDRYGSHSKLMALIVFLHFHRDKTIKFLKVNFTQSHIPTSATTHILTHITLKHREMLSYLNKSIYYEHVTFIYSKVSM